MSFIFIFAAYKLIFVRVYIYEISIDAPTFVLFEFF